MGLKSFSRSKSIHIMLVYTGGCNGCDIEIVNAVLSPKFDLEQYNVFLTWNPREADILVVTGPVTYDNKKPLEEIYASIPDPKLVVASGSCALWEEYIKIFMETYLLKKSKDQLTMLSQLMQKYLDAHADHKILYQLLFQLYQV